MASTFLGSNNKKFGNIGGYHRGSHTTRETRSAINQIPEAHKQETALIAQMISRKLKRKKTMPFLNHLTIILEKATTIL